jgi:hypothetical protein
MTTPTNSADETDPMTFAELRIFIDEAGPTYDPILGNWIPRDHVQLDGITALCQRRSDLFASALNLSHIDAIPYMEMLTIVNNAADRGIISNSMAVDLYGASAYFLRTAR